MNWRRLGIYLTIAGVFGILFGFFNVFVLGGVIGAAGGALYAVYAGFIQVGILILICSRKEVE